MNSVDEPVLSIDIINEINENPAFEHIFIQSSLNKDLVNSFNRLFNANLNFNALAPSGINSLIDKATGFNGVIACEADMTKFIEFVYKSIYLQMVDNFHNFELQHENNNS